MENEHYNPINLYFQIHLFETNPKVPNMNGYDEVKIMMTSLPVPDEFIFFVHISPCPYVYTFSNIKRIFNAIIGDKWQLRR